MIHTRFLSLGATIGATALLLQGCFDSDSSSGPADDATTDEQGIQNVIDVEETAWVDPDVRWYDDGSEGASAAPITTHHWRRELLSLDRTVTITIERPDGEVPTAAVSLEADATGLLHLWACAGDSLEHVTKDFDDHAVRSLFFSRSRVNERTLAHRGWKLEAMSGVLIQSRNTTRNLQWVRVQSGDVDMTIDNVTDLVPLEEITRLPLGAEVTVTASTGDATDAVFLHLRHLRRRMELTNNGDGTFTGTYFAGGPRGPRHLVVDVLSEGTLYDDEAPYDNIAWGIPYALVVNDDDGTGNGNGNGNGGNGNGQ
jgi:hypothetical protein